MTVNIGKDYYLNTDKIIALLPYNTARLKDEVQFKKNMDMGMRDGSLIDATRGGKIATVIICMNGIYVLSSISTETIAKRFDKAVFSA